MPSLPHSCDVLVVGGGNAGFSAAVASAEAGAKEVVIIDKCPEDWAGGNSYFTAGAMRTVHNGLSDLLSVVNNCDEATSKTIDLDPYTREDFSNDMARICLGKSDPHLSRILVEDSIDAIKWLARNGIRFQLSFNRQAYMVNGRHKFWGGMALKTQDGGKGLIEDHKRAVARHGIQVFYSTAATRLKRDPISGAVISVNVEHASQPFTINAKATILAAGGFEANPRMRSQYLGLGWDLASVRGTPFNTGDLLEIAMRDVSAKQAGDWSGCHSTAWDANAPTNRGDRAISNEFTKSGYPLGIMLNANGVRFVDEGIDMRNFTYAKFGRAILQQPQAIAFQIYDSRTTPWLRSEEYRDAIVQKLQAPTIQHLADLCHENGVQNRTGFLQTLTDYNAAVYAHRAENPSLEWNPAIKDTLSTQSSTCTLPLAKSNWALPIDKPPFLAIKVTSGITFTFGGLSVTPDTAAVISSASGTEVPGLYCAGEMLGGLFYDNYPGGSGLTAGTVFGRRAGRAAAEAARINPLSPPSK